LETIVFVSVVKTINIACCCAGSPDFALSDDDWQMFLGCDQVASVVFLTVAFSVNGAVCDGYLDNGIDIAPNVSGIVASVPNNLRNSSQVFMKLSN